MHTRSLIILGCLMAVMITITSPARAGVQVSAQVDRTTLSPGESLQLSVTIGGGDGDVDISTIADFKVHSQGTSTSVQINNGNMSREVIYNYLLIPQGKGELTIPALTVAVDGQDYHTDPIVISVADQPDNQGQASDRQRDVWVTAEVSESSPFQGQQFTYTFRLHNAVRIDNANFQPPEFKGFSAKEIEKRASHRKILKGREYMVTQIFFILTPLEPGPLTIEPAELNVGIVRRSRGRGRSPFEDFFNRSVIEPRVLQTEPLKISVRPLPPVQNDQTFSGLVGKFDLTATMETTDLKVGDSATLTITLAGKGNIMDANIPDLQLPAAFKSYADNPEEEIRLDRAGTNGKKVFRTALVPMASGEFTLPPVNVTYFDVEAKAYRTLHAKVPKIKVAPSATAQAAPVAVSPDTSPQLKKKVAFTGRDILPPKESLAAIETKENLRWPLFLLSLLGPALALGAALWVQRLRRPDTGAFAVMKTKSSRALKAATNTSSNAVLTSLYQALTYAIFAAAGRTGEALTWKEAEALLLQHHLSKEDAAQAATLLSDIESLKFSNAHLGDEQRLELLKQTTKAVRKLTS